MLRGMFVLGLVLAATGCSGPSPVCVEPTANERQAFADCWKAEVTRLVYTPGGCARDPYAIGHQAIEGCWNNYAQRHYACLSDDEVEQHRASAERDVADRAMAGQHQLRVYGQCLAGAAR